MTNDIDAIRKLMNDREIGLLEAKEIYEIQRVETMLKNINLNGELKEILQFLINKQKRSTVDYNVR